MCNLEIKPFYKSFKNINIFLANNDMSFKHVNAILFILLSAGLQINFT